MLNVTVQITTYKLFQVMFQPVHLVINLQVKVMDILKTLKTMTFMIHQDIQIILIPMLSLDMRFIIIMIIHIHMLNTMSPSIAVTEEISMGISIMNNNNIFTVMYLVA